MGGRGSAFGQQTTPQAPPVTPPQPQQQPPQSNPMPKGQWNGPTGAPGNPVQLVGGRQYYIDQNLSFPQRNATQDYLNPDVENGSMYSLSQNLNYALSHGKPLNANQQYMDQAIESCMHDIGGYFTLTRYDHPNFINKLLSSVGETRTYDQMTLPELQNALTGLTFGQYQYLSASTNDFKNAPPKTAAVFDTRAVKISYVTAPDVQAYMPGNGPGGALGEVVMNKSNTSNQKVLGVAFTGKKARLKSSQSYVLPQIEIFVQVDKQG